MIEIEYFQVFPAEIAVITIDKTVISAFFGVGLDTISGNNTDLKTVIGYKIVEQIVRIKF